MVILRITSPPPCRFRIFSAVDPRSPYDHCMVIELPTTIAVSDAVTHYRQIQELTLDELSYILTMRNHPLTPGELYDIENRTRVITVDDLMALAYSLEVSPSVLLSHIPIEMPSPEGPFATAVPADVDAEELRSWIQDRTSLGIEHRRAWWAERVTRLNIRLTHHDEQLQAAYAELASVGEITAAQEQTLAMKALHSRVQDCHHDVVQVRLALAHAERHVSILNGEEPVV